MSRVHPIVLVALLAANLPATAEEAARYRRADGSSVNAAVLDAGGSGCAPLAIISHGLGGSSNGNRPLAEALRSAGYRVVLPSHAESGPHLLMAAMRSPNRLAGVAAAAGDPTAHRARQADLDAILAVEERRCPVPHKVLGGHSIGARETLVEAGARNAAGIAGRDRFDAYIAVSAQGEGTDFFPSGAMSSIRKPVIIITGTEDRSVDGGFETRISTFTSLPPGKKRLAIIDGANHAELGGRDRGSVGETVGALAAEFARQVRPGPWGTAQPRRGVQLREK
ncbi:MAG: hypothetical protein CFE31_06335 [Rhizobiales bacterium PAR1]|nr:MAG: hypothetical protein CFE31_06335 [Rhizobiales bacterium PAR1]